jgi:hypothetical protein
MVYVITQYWDFLLLALAVGVGIGWWSEGRPAEKAEATPETTP